MFTRMLIMSKTNIDISDHFNEFIAAQIASGLYESVREVILAGLKLLETQQTLESKLQNLRSALIEGENSGDSDLLIEDIIAIAKQRRAINPVNV